MPWLQLKIDTTSEQSEQLEDLLMSSGALSVTLEDNADQPLYEPAPGEVIRWEQTRLTGLFDANTNMTAVVANIQANYGELPPYRIEALEDKDWERAWMDNYHPIQFTNRLWICPSWQPIPDEAEVVLKLDPGLAFGTGTHETTYLCLSWLDQADLSGKKVMDYGCGSGILGLAALLLGAEQAIGIDNDPQALLASEDNAGRNNLSGQFPVFLPSQTPNDRFDILIANILAGPLVSLSETIAQLVKPGGKLVLSGILADQSEDIKNAYSPWFQINHIEQKGDWIRVDATKTV